MVSETAAAKFHESVEEILHKAVEVSLGDWDRAAGPIFNQAMSYLKRMAAADDGPFMLYERSGDGLVLSFYVADEFGDEVLAQRTKFADLLKQEEDRMSGCCRSYADLLIALDAVVKSAKEAYVSDYGFAPEEAEAKWREANNA